MSRFYSEALMHTESNLAAWAKTATKSWMKVVYTIVQDTDFDAFASQALRMQPVDTELFMRSCEDMCQASCVTTSSYLR